MKRGRPDNIDEAIQLIEQRLIYDDMPPLEDHDEKTLERFKKRRLEGIISLLETNLFIPGVFEVMLLNLPVEDILSMSVVSSRIREYVFLKLPINFFIALFYGDLSDAEPSDENKGHYESVIEKAITDAEKETCVIPSGIDPAKRMIREEMCLRASLVKAYFEIVRRDGISILQYEADGKQIELLAVALVDHLDFNERAFEVATGPYTRMSKGERVDMEDTHYLFDSRKSEYYAGNKRDRGKRLYSAYRGSRVASWLPVPIREEYRSSMEFVRDDKFSFEFRDDSDRQYTENNGVPLCVFANPVEVTNSIADVKVQIRFVIGIPNYREKLGGACSFKSNNILFDSGHWDTTNKVRMGSKKILSDYGKSEYMEGEEHRDLKGKNLKFRIEMMKARLASNDYERHPSRSVQDIVHKRIVPYDQTHPVYGGLMITEVKHKISIKKIARVLCHPTRRARVYDELKSGVRKRGVFQKLYGETISTLKTDDCPRRLRNSCMSNIVNNAVFQISEEGNPRNLVITRISGDVVQVVDLKDVAGSCGHVFDVNALKEHIENHHSYACQICCE